jgi:hypothetical protein
VTIVHKGVLEPGGPIHQQAAVEARALAQKVREVLDRWKARARSQSKIVS